MAEKLVAQKFKQAVEQQKADEFVLQKQKDGMWEKLQKTLLMYFYSFFCFGRRKIEVTSSTQLHKTKSQVSFHITIFMF